MAMSARVTNTVHGMIAEKRGGSRRLHRHDPLGSTIGLVNDAGTTTDTYTYWPYGTLQASTGSTQQPWKFIGKYGYYTDSATHNYVRARKYRKDLGRWLTVDPLWPEESAYGYAGSSPITWTDPSGYLPPIFGVNCTPTEQLLITGQLDAICKKVLNPTGTWISFLKCIGGTLEGDARCSGLVGGVNVGEGGFESCFEKLCREGAPIQIRCCHNWQSCSLPWPIGNCRGKCGFTTDTKPPTIYICPDTWESTGCDSLKCTLIHEMMHYCGIAGEPKCLNCISDYVGGCKRSGAR